MVLAAGLGTRMRPLTFDRPKALVQVGGKALIDHMLDRLAAAGVRRVVVNVHAHADKLEAHLRERRDLEILISDERDALLDTGGGLKKARPLLGEPPILIANINSLWVETGAPFLETLIAGWDAARMDDLLLVIDRHSTLGFHDAGDFFVADDGRLIPRGARPRAPFAFVGVHMLDPRVIDGWPADPHGIFRHWLAMGERGRLHGAIAEGFWMHVGDPAARAAAETRL